MRTGLLAILTLAMLLTMPAAGQTQVKDLCRLEGQGSSVLQGIGIVVGLAGTGDSGDELTLARPLAKILENNGLPIGDLSELASARSAALVMVTCRTPAGGARIDDRYDITVSVLYSSTSIAGGQLYLTPLTGPYPGSPVFAIAEGPIEIDDDAFPTRGRVRGGAQIVQAINAPRIDGAVDLVIHPHAAGWQSAAHIASRIRDEYLLRPSGTGDLTASIARAIDDRTVRVSIPEAWRERTAEFLADVLSTRIDPGQLKLPARVIVSRESGAIIVTGDVEISLAAISHRNLVIRRITPPPVPAPDNPLVETERVVGIGTEGRPSERARLDDLINAMKSLNVTVEDQIDILQMLHKTGRLHAQLVID